MPRSMTGYGAARREGARVAADVELRAVNGRALKIHTRLPTILAPREPDLEALLRKRIRRGSLQLNVRLEFLRPQDAITVRPEVVEGVARAIELLRLRGVVDGKLTADAVASIPGALDPVVERALRPADWKVIRDAVEEALDRLDAMRLAEAKHLVRELVAIVKRMRKTLGTIRKRVPTVVREHKKKLRDRVDALLADSGVALDAATLGREIALLADRSDVTEEITRLDAHCEEFLRHLADGDEVGRTLEFLSQELLRETNTIGSKSADVPLARAVISLKSDVDRLKEQVANLE